MHKCLIEIKNQSFAALFLMALGSDQELPCRRNGWGLLNENRHGWGCWALGNLADQWTKLFLFNFSVHHWFGRGLSASWAFLRSMTRLVRLHRFFIWNGAQILEALVLAVAKVFGNDGGVT